jgi:eukaryotic-like serine/threonine-protein kinase
MSPEQERSGLLLRPASDVYALGIVLFEALTGRNYAFLEPGTRARALRPDTPDWLDYLLVQILEMDPDKRPWNGIKAVEQLRRGMQKKAVESSYAASHPIRWLRWGGAFALAFLIVILVAILWNQGKMLLKQKTEESTMTVPSQPLLAETENPKPTEVVVTKTSQPILLDTQLPKPTNTLAMIDISTPIHSQVPTLTPLLDIGSTWTRPADGMVMVYVPAGNFTMGSLAPAGAADEYPQHVVYLDSFWMDRTEVTNAKYSTCVHAGGCMPPLLTKSSTRPSYFGNDKYDDYPVIYVNWNQAEDYCRWAGVRLPTEAEWEKAARGLNVNLYPWGGAMADCQLANFLDCVGDTTQVDSYPSGESTYQMLNMAGNVWEWVSDWYSAQYYGQASKNKPTGPDSGSERAIRGGSWTNVANYLRTATRYKYDPDQSLSSIGFRCAKSAD